jgi:predicted nucleic acid-binding protein
MAKLIDTSVWIDICRPGSPTRIKDFLASYVLDPQAHLAEPVVFEALRHASPQEAKSLRQEFQTFPMLATPSDLWDSATEIGQNCRARGVTATSLDLLIAAVAVGHGATLVTLDDDFLNIARHSDLKVEFLRRPA